MRNLPETDLSEILQDINPLIKADNKGALKNILIELHPADIAYIVIELKKEQRKYLFNLLDSEKGSDVLTELDQPIVDQLLEDISEREISELVDQMDSDDAADIISGLPDDIADRVLDQITDEVSEEVKELLLYEEDTAGGIMALEFVQVNENDSVNETIEAIRRAKEEMDTIHAIWVVDNDSAISFRHR